jgi:hypothetical protein
MGQFVGNALCETCNRLLPSLSLFTEVTREKCKYYRERYRTEIEIVCQLSKSEGMITPHFIFPENSHKKVAYVRVLI